LFISHHNQGQGVSLVRGRSKGKAFGNFEEKTFIERKEKTMEKEAIEIVGLVVRSNLDRYI
jgi:hypothetical protein